MATATKVPAKVHILTTRCFRTRAEALADKKRLEAFRADDRPHLRWSLRDIKKIDRPNKPWVSHIVVWSER